MSTAFDDALHVARIAFDIGGYSARLDSRYDARLTSFITRVSGAGSHSTIADPKMLERPANRAYFVETLMACAKTAMQRRVCEALIAEKLL